MDSPGGKDVEADLRGSATMDLPVLTQPGLGETTTTVTTITQTGGDWSTGLFDVCGDWSTCSPSHPHSSPSSSRHLPLFIYLARCLHVQKLYWSCMVKRCTYMFGSIHSHGQHLSVLMGAFVPCCLDLSLAHQYGECVCLPLLPGSTFAMRVGIRERFKIRGSVCEDWTTVYCCYPLALCQMIREMKKRLKTQIYTVSTTLESS